MKPSAPRLLFPILLLLAAIVVVLNAWWAFLSVRTLARNAGSVAHSWQVVQQVERAMSSITDAETGERGFLISGSESYLEPYANARRSLPAELARLHSLTWDNESQRVRVDELQVAINQRMNALEQAIAKRREMGDHATPSLLMGGPGREAMNRIRALTDAMEAEEDRLLAIRTATTQTSTRRAQYAVVVASTLDFMLLVFALLQFLRERRLRLAAEIANQRLDAARREAELGAAEVRALNEGLEDRVRIRTAELERINRELEAFSYSVSHDLRAPLRTIDGFSLALQEDYTEAIDDTGRDYIRRVRGGVQRMGHLIDALLRLSRITRAEIIRERFSISELAESVAAELIEHNKGGNISIFVEPRLEVFADPRLTRVALENLLGNAVKFSAKGSHPEIHFGFDAEQKAWYVRDNGAGFDMTYADRLFGAFNRLHGDKDFTGSGIGLATVARVIERHHGRIWARSAVNQGATFWFTLDDPALPSPGIQSDVQA
jgi:signal transduction histidine kinase